MTCESFQKNLRKCLGRMTDWQPDKDIQILHGDCLEVLKTLPNNFIQTCITSPPYYNLRDYGIESQIGLERTPQEYVDKLVIIFKEIKRVLKKDGTVWLNLGDSYAGSGKGRMKNGTHAKGDNKQNTNKGTIVGRLNKTATNDVLKSKDLIGIPWRVAFALQTDGWYLRSDIIWAKTNPIPESVKDRPTRSHEYIFLLSKSKNYYYDHQSIKEPAIRKDNHPVGGKKMSLLGNRRYGHLDSIQDDTITDQKLRNKRDVWAVGNKGYKGAHFAVFPIKLIEPCVLAGTSEGATVLDPFCGSGTVGVVSKLYRRKFIGIDINENYIKLAEKRINDVQSSLFTTERFEDD